MSTKTPRKNRGVAEDDRGPRPSPRFPARPDHLDWRIYSEIVMRYDRMMDPSPLISEEKRNEIFNQITAGVADPQSMYYTAFHRVMRALKIVTADQALKRAHEIERLVGVWLDGAVMTAYMVREREAGRDGSDLRIPPTFQEVMDEVHKDHPLGTPIAVMFGVDESAQDQLRTEKAKQQHPTFFKREEES